MKTKTFGKMKGYQSGCKSEVPFLMLPLIDSHFFVNPLRGEFSLASNMKESRRRIMLIETREVHKLPCGREVREGKGYHIETHAWGSHGGFRTIGTVGTFSANPQLHLIEGNDLHSKINFIRYMEWGMNTDFQKVLNQILEVAVNEKLKEDQMIERVFVFSDMEFD
ncbi:hypothetical protein HN51_027102 [Arachis hypogaea]